MWLPAQSPDSQFMGIAREAPFRLERRLSCNNSGGRYWDRTSDLFRVREARYRCANRPDQHNNIC